MKLMTLAVAVTATVAFAHSAEARVHHHHYRHEARRHMFSHVHWVRRERYRWRREPSDVFAGSHGGYGYSARPRAWCGWEMRHLVSSDPGPSYNLARNWAHWGHAGPVGIGAVVVWPHHVGRIVGREDGMWVVESGNDGHRLRTRPRSIAGVIAIRWG